MGGRRFRAALSPRRAGGQHAHAAPDRSARRLPALVHRAQSHHPPERPDQHERSLAPARRDPDHGKQRRGLRRPRCARRLQRRGFSRVHHGRQHLRPHLRYDAAAPVQPEPADGGDHAALLRRELLSRLVLRLGLQRGLGQRADQQLRAGRLGERQHQGRGAGLQRPQQRQHVDGSGPRMQMYIFSGNGVRQVIVNAPIGGGGPFATGFADFGLQAFDFAANLVLANDGTVTPTFACSPLLAAATGKIVLVDRGNCTFSQKAANVNAAGASGMIVANNVAGVIEMGQTAGFGDNIPSLMISLADGNTLKTDLSSGPVNVTLHRPQPLDRDGTIDNQIVAHEWGHYISNRLISNASGLTTSMAGGLGEGWADFHAMLLTVKAEDAGLAANVNFGGVYAMAGYTSGGLNPDGTPNQGW